MKSGAFIFTFLSLLSAQSWGYSSSTHGLLTEYSIDHLERCYGAKILTKNQRRDIVDGNEDQDRRYLQKAFYFSHFYNPYRKIVPNWGPIDRVDSLTRVQIGQARLRELEPSDSVFWEEVGAIVHQIQDMSVPLHVIPVNHPLLKNWLSDSFEDYPYANQAIENSQRLLAKGACNPATEPRTPAEILHSLAKKTYDVTVREPVRVLMGGRPFTARWTYFWKPADRYSQSGFGSYGVFGNNFGSSDFEIEGANVHVDSQIYFKFMVDRMKDAQRSTIEAIEWALQGAQ